MTKKIPHFGPIQSLNQNHNLPILPSFNSCRPMRILWAVLMSGLLINTNRNRSISMIARRQMQQRRLKRELLASNICTRWNSEFSEISQQGRCIYRVGHVDDGDRSYFPHPDNEPRCRRVSHIVSVPRKCAHVLKALPVKRSNV